MSKITDEQLKELQELISKLNQAKLQLGQTEVQKHSLLHQTNELENQMSQTQQKLQDEYGKISINIEDGSYEIIAEEEESN
jgi:hypothetical protein